MRNLQKDIIPEWKPCIKITELIKELPNLCSNFECQIVDGLLPSLGEYFINSYNYDINEFLRNLNIKCFNILVPKEEEKVIIFHVRYLVVTSRSIIILEPVNKQYNNICKINYVGDLFEIDKIEKFLENKEEYKDFTCFRIIWNNNYNNKLNYTMCGDTNKQIVNNIIEYILKRKENMKNAFKYIQNYDSTNINTLEEIIKIKEKLIKDKTNEAIFVEISTLYQKIIEVLSSSDVGDIQIYLEKLHNFIDTYDSLKLEEAKKKEIQKSKDINNNENGGSFK